MLKLYYAPAAVSLVTHIALEELELPHELVRVSLRKGEHREPAYRAVHPLSRVPALEIAPGEVLTETPALLWYLSGLKPEARLMPEGQLAVARANEWMSLFASAVHVSFISFFLPGRYTDDEAAGEALKKDGRARFAALMRHVESRLPERGFLFGERYGLVDAYASVFHVWARHMQVPVDDLPRYARLVGEVFARPAVRRALLAEGIAGGFENPPVAA